MPVLQGSASIAAASVNDNVLTGSQYEFLPYNAFIEFGLNGDANGGDLRVDVYSGPDVIMENAPMSVVARIPIYPDDFVGSDAAAAGERLKVRVRNTHATTARTIYWNVRITPL